MSGEVKCNKKATFSKAHIMPSEDYLMPHTSHGLLKKFILRLLLTRCGGFAPDLLRYCYRLQVA